MEIGLLLKIKFGLRSVPNQQQILQWYNEVRRQMDQGKHKDEAGEDAAQLVFPDYGYAKYAGEADTIEALLDKIREKEGLVDEGSK